MQTNYINEFEADLESHPIGNQNTYRLYYVNYHRSGVGYLPDSRIGEINWPCKPFQFPDKMTREEGFKVLSYLTDVVESRKDIKPFSLKSIQVLDKIIDIKRFGFKRVEEENEDNILNLFTITGRILLFKKSNLYAKYFEWYQEGVTLEEVKEIYSRCNLEFKDVEWLENSEEKEHIMSLTKKN